MTYPEISKQPFRQATFGVASVTRRSDQASRASSLLDHDLVTGPANCFARAVAYGRGPDGGGSGDELAFYSAPHHGTGPGHVMLRCVASGAVREPGAVKLAAPTAAAYAAVTGRQLLATAPVEAIRTILRRPPAKRAAIVREAGGPVTSVAHLAFGASTAPDYPYPPKGPGVTFFMESPNDQDVREWLTSLGNAVSKAEKKELLQTAEDAKNVWGYFNNQSISKSEMKNPPDAIRQAWDRLMSSPVIRERLDSHPFDGVRVYVQDILAFLNDLNDAADSAQDSWESFKEDNPNPDELTLTQALDASILQANLPILDQADRPHDAADNQFNKADLRTVAASSDGGEGLSDPLKLAAGFYGEPGTYDILTEANTNPIPAAPPTVDNDHLNAYLASLTPQSPEDAEQALSHAAIVKVVKQAGGDPNVLSAEDFYGPNMTSGDREKYPSDMPLGTYLGNSKASPADKAATLLQLSELYGKLQAGKKWLNATSENSTSFERAFEAQGMTLSQFTGMLNTSINTLGSDPEVAKFFQDKFPGSIALIVGQDPAIKGHYQKVFDDNTAGSDLDHALEPAMVGSFLSPGLGPSESGLAGDFASKQTPLVTKALTGFIDKVTDYSQAIGLKPDEFKARMEKAYAEASPATQKLIQRGYDNLTSGARVKALIEAGESPEKAISQASQELISYNTVLPLPMVQNGSQKFVNYNNKMVRNDLADGKTVPEMLAGLGIRGLNDPQLKEFIRKHYDELVPPGPFQPTIAEIVLGLRGLNDGLRGARKFDAALKNIQGRADNGHLPPKLQRAYSKGTLHAASALLFAGAIVDRSHVAKTAPLAVVSNALTAGGLLLDSAGKRWSFKLQQNVNNAKKHLADVKRLGASKPSIEAAQARVAEAEARQKKSQARAAALEDHGGYPLGIAGAVAGAAASAFLLEEAIKSGDKGSIILNSIGTALFGISAVTQTAEYAPKVITSLPKVVNYWGHLFGAVTNIAGVLYGIGILAYIGVEEITQLNDYSHNAGVLYGELREGASPLVDLYNERQLGETRPADPVWRW